MSVEWMKRLLKRILAERRYTLKELDDLTYLADSFGSDKGNLFDAHGYTRIYKNVFSRIRNDNIRILEIGLLRFDIDGRRSNNVAEGATNAVAARAPSLEMWRAYFPNAEIFGFDIDDFSKVKIDGCSIIRGDMCSRDDLARLARTIGQPIDIVIDDGSHASHHQQIALGYLFSYVRSGGLYVIEDLHWQPPEIEKVGAPKTRDVLRRFQLDGVFESPFLSAEERRYVQTRVSNLRLFDSLTSAVDDPSDALAILQKSELPL